MDQSAERSISERSISPETVFIQTTMRQNKILYNLVRRPSNTSVVFSDIIYTAIYTRDLPMITNILNYLKTGLKTFITSRELDLMLDLGMFDTMASFKPFIPRKIILPCLNKYLHRCTLRQRQSAERKRCQCDQREHHSKSQSLLHDPSPHCLQCNSTILWALDGLEKSLSSGMVKHPYEIYMLLKTCNQLGLAEHAQVLLQYIKETSLEVRVVRYALGHRPKFIPGHKVDENVLSLVIKPYLERSAIRAHISTLSKGEGNTNRRLYTGRSLEDASRIIDILKVLKKSYRSLPIGGTRTPVENRISRTIKQLNHAYKTSFRSIRI
jgi:hypothetical protein